MSPTPTISRSPDGESPTFAADLTGLVADTVRFVNRSSGVVRGVLVGSAVLLVVFGWVFGFVALADDELAGAERIIVLALMFGIVGVVLPIWMVRMRAIASIAPHRIRIRLAGLFGVRFDPATIEMVEIDRVDPMVEFGGYGIKGKRGGWMFGMSGTVGVQIAYRHRDGTRRVTFLCDSVEEAEEMAAAVEAVRVSRPAGDSG